jgi:hypothetical protein
MSELPTIKGLCLIPTQAATQQPLADVDAIEVCMVLRSLCDGTVQCEQCLRRGESRLRESRRGECVLHEAQQSLHGPIAKSEALVQSIPSDKLQDEFLDAFMRDIMEMDDRMKYVGSRRCRRLSLYASLIVRMKCSCLSPSQTVHFSHEHPHEIPERTDS